MEQFDLDEMRIKIEKVKEKIHELAKDPLRENLKEFYVMGLITPLLDELGADPAVIVGGHAVELYTSGSYTTVDVDIVMVKDDIARTLFDKLGFLREGRFHYLEDMDIPIEFPSSKLAGTYDRIIKLNTPDGYCYVIGVEDLILDRLNAAEFWQDNRSLEWARYLISCQFDGLDFSYLREKASEDNPNLLRRLEDTIEWVKENTVD